MRVSIENSINLIDAKQWNALNHNNNPFLSYEFLSTLEKTSCLGKEFGWHPCFFTVYNDNDQLVGAAPAYLKENTYGEFVFDMAWADFYSRNNRKYYPKLVSCIPYSPINSEQMLVASSHDETEVWSILSQAMQQFCESNAISGSHILFNPKKEIEFLKETGWIIRQQCQYHWQNNQYKDFEDFLSFMTAKKRKNIRQERKKIRIQNISFNLKDGTQLGDEELKKVFHYYAITFDRKWGFPTLTEDFFRQIAKKLGKQFFVIFAKHEDKIIACSTFFKSDTTLYGRYWGCDEFYENLHFETCYYRPIEYCIQNGIQIFEPGAQGEHKIPRGFLPTTTWSAHWLKDEDFHQIIQNHVNQENPVVMEHCEQLKKMSPFKDPS